MFAGPPAAYSERIAPAGDAAPTVLRTLSVEERAGVGRKSALVRVPLFFAEGECPTLDHLAIVPAAVSGQGAALIWQADDIRRGPDGGIARVHLWFEADLAADEKRTYHLVRRPAAAGTQAAPRMNLAESTGGLRIRTAAGDYVFSRAGGLRSVPAARGGWDFEGEGAFPAVAIDYAATASQPPQRVDFDAASPGRSVEWGTGPLFTKLRVTVGAAPGGAVLEQEYRIPRAGRELVVSTALLPGPGGVVKLNRLLVGRMKAGRAPVLHRVPAGVRYALRAEHAYTVSGLGSANEPATLLAVPLVVGGTNGQWSLEPDGRAVLEGQRGLQRGTEGEQGTLHGYWTEIRLVPAASSTPLEAWKTYREHVQPLVAVVDEPAASIEALHAALSDLIREMKPIGWRQEAGRAMALGEKARLAKILAAVSPAREGDAASLVQGAHKDTAKITQNGARKLREDEKGRAYGRLDPYHITYTQSAAAAVDVLGAAPATVSEVSYAMAKGARDFGGRADQTGFPYIDCFNRTLNMQLGPVLFGLTAGAKQGDTELVRFYRDLATAPPVLGVFGRGQRPYTGAPANSADQTDFLYQAISDFWLRTAELLANEDLHLHPLAYARYTDCVDVMADRYHSIAAKQLANDTAEVRANFYRGQVHTHRWLGWSCAPYIRLLEDPAEHAAIGLTEAIRHTRAQKGRWKNWPDLTYYELADLLVRSGLDRYVRPPRPAAVGGITVRPRDEGVDVSWAEAPGAADYRLYRTAGNGGPYTWVNSPYLGAPVPKPGGTTFHDMAGKPGSTYVVIAVDAAGRDSAWSESP